MPDFVSLNPGPSQLYPQVQGYLQDAYTSGILSLSHRSSTFTALYEGLVSDFRAKLHLPRDYTLLLLSSATECWSVLADGLTRGNSLHLYCGDFGQRWWEHANQIHFGATGVEVGIDTAWSVEADTLRPLLHRADLVCLTQNETSRGAQIPLKELAAWTADDPTDPLLAVDVTSSLAGIELPLDYADVWFASVQKCFGLPAGLAVLALSPRAVARAKDIGFEGRYNALVRQLANAEKFQTTHTPNVLNIYLLRRLLADLPDIADIHAQTAKRAQAMYNFLEEHAVVVPLVERPENRSLTTIAVKAPEDFVQRAHDNFRLGNLQLGNGYGALKASTFRIANFPAVPDAALEKARDILWELA